MRLSVIFQCVLTSADQTPAAKSIGAPPHLVNLFGLRSLIASIQQAFMHQLMSDVQLTAMMHRNHSQAVTLDQHALEINSMQELLKNCPFPTRLVNGILRQIEGGPAAIAKKSSAELLYFVDGDTLHSQHCLAEMLLEYHNFAQKPWQDLLITPLDQPALYQGPNPTRILPGTNRYWRTVNQCSRTMLLGQKTFERFGELFEYDSRLNDSNQLQDGNALQPMLRLIPCYAPMPSLAVSLQAPEIPAFTPILQWWHQIEASQSNPLRLTSPIDMSPSLLT